MTPQLLPLPPNNFEFNEMKIYAKNNIKHK